MKKIIILLFLSTLLSSCTYRWYREFLPDESLSKQETYGWVFEPELFAYKNVAGDEPPSRSNKFYFKIRYDNADKFNSQLKEISIDSVKMQLFPTLTTEHLTILDEYYYSMRDGKLLSKSFVIGKIGSNNNILVEENIDSLIISFNAKFADAILTKKYLNGYYRASDSVYVIDTIDYEVVPIEFMMYRHESKTKIPAFFKSM